MKYLMLAIIALFAGCGSDGTEKTDFWDYRVSDTTITKFYAQEVYEDGFIMTYDSFSYMVDETIEDNSAYISFGSDLGIQFDLKDNHILKTPTNGEATKEKRFIRLGDNVFGDCIAHKFYGEYEISQSGVFDDVLQLKCDTVDDGVTVYINYSSEYGNIGRILTTDTNVTVIDYMVLPQSWELNITDLI